MNFLSSRIVYNNSFNPALQGLRGIAIILVIFFHCLGNSFPILSQINKLGWIGVDLFFVLSGFLITGGILDKKKGKRFSFKQFYWNRILRIFPVYFVSLVSVLTTIIIFNLESYHLFIEEQWIFWTFTENIYFAFQGWPKEIGLLNHFWSLAIEEQFYLVWPLFLFFLPRKYILTFCLILISIAIFLRFIYSDPNFSYFFTLTRMDSLVMGAIGAYIIRNNIEALNRFIILSFILSLLSIITVYNYSNGFSLTHPNTIKYGFSTLSIFFTISIIMVFNTNKSSDWYITFLSIKALQSIGKYSYAIYAYHWILYIAFYPRLLALLKEQGIQFPNYLSIILFLIGIYLLSFISYQLMEKRFLSKKVTFTKKNNLA